MMVFPYMIPVYSLLVKAGACEIGSLLEQYQVPVAVYLTGKLKQVSN